MPTVRIDNGTYEIVGLCRKSAGQGGGLSFLFPHTVRFLSFFQNIPSFCRKRAEIDQKGRLRIDGLHKINRYATKKDWVSWDCGT